MLISCMIWRITRVIASLELAEISHPDELGDLDNKTKPGIAPLWLKKTNIGYKEKHTK